MLSETDPGNGSISFPAEALPAAEDRSVAEDVDALHAFIAEAYQRAQGPSTGNATAQQWHMAFTVRTCPASTALRSLPHLMHGEAA